MDLKIYLVDDHRLFREGLSLLLSSLDFISTIYEADSGIELLKRIEKNRPDLILMDIEMPEMSGIETCRRVLAQFPEIKIIALSMYSDERYYSQMIEAGAKGFLLKNSKFDDVKSAIEEVMNGHNYFSSEILTNIISNFKHKPNRRNHSELSSREIEILLRICQAESNQEIADALFISKRTVDKHRENLLLKTESKNTAGLVIFAVKNGLIEV